LALTPYIPFGGYKCLAEHTVFVTALEDVAFLPLPVQKQLLSDPRDHAGITAIKTYVPPQNNTQFYLKLNKLCAVSKLVIKLTAFQHTV
jgi:hypothetical protein